MTDPKYRTATATTLGKGGAGGGGQGGGGHERPETAALATAAAAAGAERLYPSLQNYHHVLIKARVWDPGGVGGNNIQGGVGPNTKAKVQPTPMFRVGSRRDQPQSDICAFQQRHNVLATDLAVAL